MTESVKMIIMILKVNTSGIWSEIIKKEHTVSYTSGGGGGGAPAVSVTPKKRLTLISE